MSGYSETRDCPRCGAVQTLEHSEDRELRRGLCYVCGYWYYTVREVMSLDDLNGERDLRDMEPLLELRPPISGWVD